MVINKNTVVRDVPDYNEYISRSNNTVKDMQPQRSYRYKKAFLILHSISLHYIFQYFTNKSYCHIYKGFTLSLRVSKLNIYKVISPGELLK